MAELPVEGRRNGRLGSPLRTLSSPGPGPQSCGGRAAPRHPRSLSELRGRDESQDSFLWFQSITHSILHPHFLPYLRSLEGRKKQSCPPTLPVNTTTLLRGLSLREQPSHPDPVPPLPGSEKAKDIQTPVRGLSAKGATPHQITSSHQESRCVEAPTFPQRKPVSSSFWAWLPAISLLSVLTLALRSRQGKEESKWEAGAAPLPLMNRTTSTSWSMMNRGTNPLF